MTEVIINNEIALQLKLTMNENGENIIGGFRFWITPFLSGEKAYKAIYKENGEFDGIEEFDLNIVK